MFVVETYKEALEKIDVLTYKEHAFSLESEDSGSEYQKKMILSVRRNQLLREQQQLQAVLGQKDADTLTLPSVPKKKTSSTASRDSRYCYFSCKNNFKFQQ